MASAVSPQRAAVMTKPPEAPAKPMPRWAERHAAFMRQREKTKAQIDVSQRDYLKNKGRLPPRAKSTNSKPSRPQVRTVNDKHVTLPSTVHNTSSDTALNERMQRLSVRSGSVASNHSTTSSVTSTSSRQTRLTRNRVRSASTFCQSLEDMVNFIQSQRAKNIVVMCGAGISTASGIPDFRSPGTGLYANLKQYKIPYPESIFDLDYFEGNPKPFYTLAKELYPTGKYRPNYVHYFLRLLHDKGLLLRIYTQNIDGLERMAGVPLEKLVEAHGTFYTSSCIKCRESYQSDIVRRVIYSDKLPRCHKNRCLGLIKPDIVFFGEDLHRRFYYYLKDFPQADMLLVMGTSLEVEPFAGIVDSVRLTVPRILFNRNAVGPFKKKRRMNDTVVKGDIVAQVTRASELLGWHEELQQLIDECEKNASVEAIEELGGDDKSNLSAAGLVAHPSSHPTSNQPSAQPTSQTSKQPTPLSAKTNTPAKYATGVHKSQTKPKSVSAAPNMGGIHRTAQNGGKLPARNNSKSKKPLQLNNVDSILPRLKKPPSFHAQASLYRTNSKRTEVNHFSAGCDSDSSEEESESDDSDDD